ncbi:MAG: DUF493 domain-containing protein [Gammaproteobacteria bacterium]|nr:DUF493 domain-containing protein [Gammaproteobacteria bacterium]
MAIDTHFTFPCYYPLKIIGQAHTLESAALPILHKHIPDLGEGAITLKPSSDNKYLSLTVNLHAQSKEQLDALYQELSSHKDIIMVL